MLKQDLQKCKKLNFGSGVDYREGYVNMDYGDKNIYNVPIKVDVKHDFRIFPYPFKNNEFEYIIANHVIEHFCHEDLKKIFKELHRITKENGIIEIIVPYFSNFHAVHDPTHKSLFTQGKIKQFYCGLYMPNCFEIIKSDIRLTNSTFRFVNYFLNISESFKNVYERFFCYWFPAQDIRVIVKVRK